MQSTQKVNNTEKSKEEAVRDLKIQQEKFDRLQTKLRSVHRDVDKAQGLWQCLFVPCVQLILMNRGAEKSISAQCSTDRRKPGRILCFVGWSPTSAGCFAYIDPGNPCQANLPSMSDRPLKLFFVKRRLQAEHLPNSLKSKNVTRRRRNCEARISECRLLEKLRSVKIEWLSSAPLTIDLDSSTWKFCHYKQTWWVSDMFWDKYIQIFTWKLKLQFSV